MSHIAKFVVPMIVAGAVVGAACIAVISSSAAEQRDQTLRATDGTRIHAVFDAKSRSFKVALKDGTYKLTNGGAIKVQGGRIVWDAFGAIEKLKGSGTYIPNPVG